MDRVKAIGEDVKEKVTTFSKNFLSFYKDGLVDEMIDAKAAQEVPDSEEDKPQLLRRPADGKVVDTEPLMTGEFQKRGAKVKNWKQRYFVVLPTYKVQYFDSKDTYESGGKPKGTIMLDGYKMYTDPNARKKKAKEALNKKLGADSGPVEYEKYEPLTLEGYHDERRRWLFKFENKEDFDAWNKMFTKCCKFCKSGLLTDKDAIEAFAKAFKVSQKECTFPADKKKPEFGGTESDMLVQLFTLHAKGAHLQGLELPGGNPKVKKMALSKIEGAAKAAVSAAVIPAWKLASEGAIKSKETVKSGLDKSLDPVITARQKITDELKGKIEPKAAPVMDKVLEPIATHLMKVVAPVLKEGVASTKPVYDKAAEGYKANLAKGGDVAGHRKKFALALISGKSHKETVKIMGKADDPLNAALKKLPEAVSSKVEVITDALDIDNWIAESVEAAIGLADNAGYTLQQELGDSADNYDEVKASVDAKFAHDVSFVAKDRLKELVAPALITVLTEELAEVTGPILEPIEAQIPDVAKKFLTPSGILEALIEDMVYGVASKAADTNISAE